jgi:hypothetical protein
VYLAVSPAGIGHLTAVVGPFYTLFAIPTVSLGLGKHSYNLSLEPEDWLDFPKLHYLKVGQVSDQSQ